MSKPMSVGSGNMQSNVFLLNEDSPVDVDAFVSGEWEQSM